MTPVPTSPSPENEPPLVFDLDGTLLDGDCLWEALLWAASKKPWVLAKAASAAATRGRPGLKTYLSEQCEVHLERAIPRNQAAIRLLESEKAKGRACVLATASPEKWAREINVALGNPFQKILATGAKNLKGASKAQALEKEFGAGGFDYVGDSPADIPVWKIARKCYLAGGSPKTTQIAKAAGVAVEALEPPREIPWARVLRTHQWAKNLLVLVPLFTAHKLSDPAAILTTWATVLAFCATASGNYILNDLWDAPNDRKHPTKRTRPLALGQLGVPQALTMAAALLTAGLGIGWAVSPAVAATLALYLAATTLYSHWAKTVVILDTLILSGLYCLRLWVGGLAAGAPVSFWLLSASMFLFFSLALGKRDAELNAHLKTGGRGYQHGDRASISGLGAASAIGAAFMLCLYIESPEAAQYYKHHALLWVLPAGCLYWAGRFWIICGRGQMNEDPVVWAAYDRPTQICGAIILAALTAAHLLTR